MRGSKTEAGKGLSGRRHLSGPASSPRRVECSFHSGFHELPPPPSSTQSPWFAQDSSDGLPFCISGLWLLQQINTKQVAQNNRNVFSPSSRGRNQGISRAKLSPETLGETPFLDSPSFSWLPAFLGLWLHHSSLRLLDLIACVCLCQISLSLPVMWTLVIVFRAPSDKSGQCPHLEVFKLNHTCK